MKDQIFNFETSNRKNFGTFALALAVAAMTVLGCSARGESSSLEGQELENSEEGAPSPTDGPSAELLQEPRFTDGQKQKIFQQFSHLDPEHRVSTLLKETALLYHQWNLSRLLNPELLTIIDFSLHSSANRLHIIDLKSGTVQSMQTSHGSGSDKDNDGFAERFSNEPRSNATSLGFYITGDTYYGKHGLSLKLDGVSVTNSEARRRSVVIHGAKYVNTANIKTGRSWGCPAVPLANRDRVIQLLKNGSMIYAGLSK
jgi:L,D-transpeptidase catalytic domain